MRLDTARAEYQAGFCSLNRLCTLANLRAEFYNPAEISGSP
jgi:hypothetical protein